MVRGASAVEKALLSYEQKGRGVISYRVATLNGKPALVTLIGERMLFATFVEGDGSA